MTDYSLVCRMKAYIQPFERELALRELAQVSQTQPVLLPDLSPDPLLYQVTTAVSPRRLLNQLAYWESVANGRVDLTAQVLREATVNISRNGITPEELATRLPFNDVDVPVPNRRCLRYGPHGIHEYRGKFFPQLVRSLINIANLKPETHVLDPMSGSGTTAVEALLRGCRVRGIDVNPLSVLMSQTKCGLLSVNPDELAGAYSSLQDSLSHKSKSTASQKRHWLDSLPERDSTYLRAWFAPEILSTLDLIMRRIQKAPIGPIQNLFLMVLSNTLRSVSWQKADDLRVRKEVRPTTDYDPIGDFLAKLERSAKTVLAFLYNDGPLTKADWQIQLGDARQINRYLKAVTGRVDAIITSPPYATALPYLDTDRLSLCYLGLLPRSEHREWDGIMIGNREITDAQRRRQWEIYTQRKTELPSDIQVVIEKIDQLNQDADVGFRRRNLPALLAKYFFDMQDVFQGMKLMLRAGAPAFVVVGNNHTLAGGQRVEIETDRLLGQLGESVGLQLKESLPMDMLVSRDIFKKNTGTAETILFFYK